MDSARGREDSILKFVKEQQKPTKADVIRYMHDAGISSTVTTHKDIMNLIDEKKLLVLKDKSNSKPHRLIINNKNEYNLINEQLLEMEAHVDEMNESMDNFRNLRDSDLKSELNIRFVSNYIQLVETMLQRLLVKTDRTIRSVHESQFFYSRIAKLMLSLNCQQRINYSRKLQDLSASAQAMGPQVYRISLDIETRAKSYGINTKLNDRMMKMWEDFKNRF